MKTFPTFDIENEILSSHGTAASAGRFIIAGTDEAGRGPLCGPVVAAAVIFRDTRFDIRDTIINDSKKMTHAEREAAYEWITKNTIWATGMCGAAKIDEINILQASMLAMKRAIENLSLRPDFVLVDGNRMPEGVAGRAVVKGDGKSMSIAAASIIAKVSRDRIMAELAKEFPEYGWDKNRGYPTAAHIAAIEKHGITQHHRKTYAPVKKLANA